VIRTGLIGLGKWGKRLLPVLDHESTVVMCANRSDPDARDWLLENVPGILHTYDAGSIFRDESIEAVVISTPISTHYDLAKLALESGKHVFIEKPMVTSVQEVAELYTLARSKNLALTTGYIFLHNPVMHAVQKIVDTDPVVLVQMSWEKYGTFGESIYWNLVSHELSIAFNLFRASLVRMRRGEETGKVTDVDKTTVELQFAGGESCTITTDRISKNKRKAIEIHTASDRTLVWENESLYERESTGDRLALLTNDSDTLQLEIHAFIRSLQTGKIVYEQEMNTFITDVLLRLTR